MALVGGCKICCAFSIAHSFSQTNHHKETTFPTLSLSLSHISKKDTFFFHYTLPLPQESEKSMASLQKMLWERVEIQNQVGGPGARVGHTCNVVGNLNFLYVFGGYDANRNFTNSVFIFDTSRSFRNLSSKFPFLFDTTCLTSMFNFCYPSFYIQLWHYCVSCKLLFYLAFLSNLWNIHGFTLINLCLDVFFFCIPILSNFYFSLFSCKICGICMVWNWLIYIGMLFFKGFLFVKFLCHCCVSCFPFFFFWVSISFF